MTSILNKFKSLAIVVMVFSFFMVVTLNSCTSEKGSENTEASAGEEHPEAEGEGEEHPEGEEGEGEEEHPEGEGEGEEEHPEGEGEEEAKEEN